LIISTTFYFFQTSSKPRHQAGSCSASQPVGDCADGQPSQIERNVSTVLSAQNVEVIYLKYCRIFLGSKIFVFLFPDFQQQIAD
jgi:hypothetical protein